MTKIGFRPNGAMGMQALKALDMLLNSREQSDILWAGQILEAIAANGSRMNSTDRANLLVELSMQASLGLGEGYLNELRRTILVRTFRKLDS